MCVSCNGSVVEEGKPSLEVVEFLECHCIYCMPGTVCVVFSVIDLSQRSWGRYCYPHFPGEVVAWRAADFWPKLHCQEVRL